MASVDRAGRSVVHYAALEGRSEDLAAMLVEGEDPFLADYEGWTPLHFAAQSQHADIAQQLLDAGVPVDVPNSMGLTPLYVAFKNVKDRPGDTIRVLLEAGADPDRPNNAGRTVRDYVDLVANFDLKQHLPPATNPGSK